MIETIRHLAISRDLAEDLVHVVRDRASRGYNGTDYVTACGAHLMSSVKWNVAQYDTPTCLRCLGSTSP